MIQKHINLFSNRQGREEKETRICMTFRAKNRNVKGSPNKIVSEPWGQNLCNDCTE